MKKVNRVKRDYEFRRVEEFRKSACCGCLELLFCPDCLVFECSLGFRIPRDVCPYRK